MFGLLPRAGCVSQLAAASHSSGQDLTVINVLRSATHLHRSVVTHSFQVYTEELFVIKQPLWVNPELHQSCQDIFICIS